jgi:hypothetical protein
MMGVAYREKKSPSFPNTFLFGCFFLVFFGVIARRVLFQFKKIDKIGGMSADSRAAGPKKLCVGAYFMIPKDEKTKR